MALIKEPGVYPTIAAEAYHVDPCPAPSLSSSIGELLIERSPLHAWFAHPRLNKDYAPKESAAFDLGKAAHSLMLGDPQDFAIIDADDWRTKEAKAQRDEAYVARKIPLLRAQWDRVVAMVAAGRKQLAAHEDARDAFTAGKPEVTLVWREVDVWCRARPDWMHDKLPAPWRDYKTTGVSAEPDSFARQLYGMGYDFQAAFYRRGIRALGLDPDPRFEFVVQETEAPYALAVIGLPPAALDLANRKCEEAIAFWDWCLKKDSWPGYPARTAYVDPPGYHEARWLGREARDALATEHGADARFAQGLRFPLPEYTRA